MRPGEPLVRTLKAVMAVVALVAGPVTAVVTGTASPAKASTACSSVKMIGLRGSGESFDPAYLGMGPTLYTVYQQVKTTASGTGGFTADGVDYPAYDFIAALQAGEDPATVLAAFQQSIVKGFVSLSLYVSNEVNNCPNEKLILAGFSQGAAIVGDYAEGLNSKNSIFSHIAGVLLWADPEYNGSDILFSDPEYGTGILGARGTYNTDWFGKLISFCTSLDPVCNFTSIPSLLQNVSHHGDERFNPVLCKSAADIAQFGGFGAACYSSKYDNTDPFSNPYQNCGVGQYPVFSVADPWGGTLQLRWGPNCQTNWARLVPSNSLTHRIWVERQLSNFFSVGNKFQFSVPAGVPAWSDQLYAPHQARACDQVYQSGAWSSAFCTPWSAY